MHLKSIVYKVLQLKESYQVNVIYTPVLMLVVFTICALTLIQVDRLEVLSEYFGNKPWFSIAASKQILATVASSVITIIAVVFSISIVTLSIAANLLGPRLIPNFIKKGQTQFAIGTFTGTFVYNLVILATLEKHPLAPQFSVLLAIILSFLSLLVLIYYIHFVCQNIQVEYTLETIMKDLKSSMRREFATETYHAEPHESGINTQFHQKAYTDLLNQKPGYIKFINYESLAKWAKEHHFTLKLFLKPGDYVISDSPLMRIYRQDTTEVHDSVLNQALKYISMGETRTALQDIEFLFEEISEIALRALSPGINNPYTAMLCINHIAEGIQYMSGFYNPKQTYVIDNHLCVMARKTTIAGVVKKSLDRLRQQSVSDLSVTIKLLEMIRLIYISQNNHQINTCLMEQAQLIFEDGLKHVRNDPDREDLELKFKAIQDSLAP